MSQLDVTTGGWLEAQLPVGVEISAPPSFDEEDYGSWAGYLLQQRPWPPPNFGQGLPGAFTLHERLYVALFLSLTRALLELARIPVFNEPAIVSAALKDAPERTHLLELAIPKVDFLPQEAYRKPVKAALDLCRWLALNPPTARNRELACKVIDEQVLQPMAGLFPAGKSTIPVLRAAHQLGIPFMHLGLGIYQIGWGSRARKLDRSTTDLDSSIGSKLSWSKAITADMLRTAGLPAPDHHLVRTERDALLAATRLGFPVVVKPSDRERGEGVSVDINDPEALRRTFSEARQLSRAGQVIVERQVPGVCHRLFIAQGRLLYAVKRLPMSVLADGVRSVNQLVNDELEVEGAKPSWLRSKLKPIDELARAALARAGYAPETVVPAGVLVPLRRIETTELGGVDEDVSAVVDPENLAVAVAATALFSLRVAGIDIISPDISRPWHENGAIINEVNFAPLLGGGEISRLHIPDYLARFIEGDGRIPVESFGNQALATKRHTELVGEGIRCFLTSGVTTRDPAGRLIVMPLRGLKQRVRALFHRADVDAIVTFSEEP